MCQRLVGEGKGGGMSAMVVVRYWVSLGEYVIIVNRTKFNLVMSPT